MSQCSSERRPLHSSWLHLLPHRHPPSAGNSNNRGFVWVGVGDLHSDCTAMGVRRAIWTTGTSFLFFFFLFSPPFSSLLFSSLLFSSLFSPRGFTAADLLRN